MTSKPTKTTNRIHFTDLDPMRFEDLALALVYPLHPWIEIRHYGRSGGDGGVDITAKELVENDQERIWSIQCRRYKSATEARLKKAVDDSLEKASTPPEVLLVVIACDSSRKAHEAYIEYAASKGVKTPLIWTASILEAQLYSKRRDLLFSYFGISTTADERQQEMIITRNIAIKKHLRKELLKDAKQIDMEKVLTNPREQFRFPKVIIRSIDDSSYPNNLEISGWFKLNLWDFSNNGLEVISNDYDNVVMIKDKDGNFTPIQNNQSFDSPHYEKIKVFKIAQIPFQNIVDIDTNGYVNDSEPQIYCRFINDSLPYDNYRYVRRDDGSAIDLMG